MARSLMCPMQFQPRRSRQEFKSVHTACNFVRQKKSCHAGYLNRGTWLAKLTESSRLNFPHMSWRTKNTVPYSYSSPSTHFRGPLCQSILCLLGTELSSRLQIMHNRAVTLNGLSSRNPRYPSRQVNLEAQLIGCRPPTRSRASFLLRLPTPLSMKTCPLHSPN